MLLVNILIVLVCFTSMSLLMQTGIYGRKLANPDGPFPEHRYLIKIEGPIQLETEVRKILNEMSEEDSDLKKIQQVILIGAKHCGAGKRLPSW